MNTLYISIFYNKISYFRQINWEDYFGPNWRDYYIKPIQIYSTSSVVLFDNSIEKRDEFFSITDFSRDLDNVPYGHKSNKMDHINNINLVDTERFFRNRFDYNEKLERKFIDSNSNLERQVKVNVDIKNPDIYSKIEYFSNIHTHVIYFNGALDSYPLKTSDFSFLILGPTGNLDNLTIKFQVIPPSNIEQ